MGKENRLAQPTPISNLGNMMTNKPGATPLRVYDENVFTFKPKVSATSVKIAESLGTDFMSRQQQHLEKQKRHVSITLIVTLCLCMLNLNITL